MVMMRAVPAAALKQVKSSTSPAPSGRANSGSRRAGSNGRGAGARVEHVPEWRAPAPLWDLALAAGDAPSLFRPAILRFDRDEFMDDLLKMLENSPGDLPQCVAQPETWRDERAGWLPSGDARWTSMPFKLFQPAHKRHYLVAAELVCRIPGLPRRAVDSRNDEQVFFVLRRLAPKSPGETVDPHDPTTYVEEAWGGAGKGWLALGDPGRLADFDGFSEERHPLFGVAFELNGQKRRLHAGLIPVSSGESYQAAGPSNPFEVPPSAEGEVDPRIQRFASRVERPLRDYIRAATSASEAQGASTFILYDFAELLRDHFAPVWELVEEGEAPDEEPPPGQAIEALAYELNTGHITNSGTTWREGLLAVWAGREKLLAGDPDAPAFTIDRGEITGDYVDDLRAKVEAAVGKLGAYQPPANPGGDETVPTLPMLDDARSAHYVIRCVYVRPRCGDLHPPLVSEPSRPFQIASFFDPDAPTRPVRISLPVDTSIAGLRKFKRDVSFFASKQLRSQMERLRGAGFSTLEDGPPAGGNFDLGMVCTLSIPIITICAMILLLIILQLLNFVFWWLPFCKICFPIRR